MTRIRDLHTQWLKDPEYRAEYERLAPEFGLTQTLIEARLRAGLTQAELARRMNTTQSVIARLEGGHVLPSIRTLERIAQATGSHLRIDFDFADPPP